MGIIGGCCLSLIAIVAPPVPVLLRTGCGGSLIINCLLCILGWVPGIFHAWYIIIRYPDGKHRANQARNERRNHQNEIHQTGYASPPPAARYGAAPPAAQGLYCPPPQEMGHTSRRY